jgi:DNA-binding NtrC family response regulator
VLVVDDERPVRVLMRDVLRLHGYDVLEAGDGAEAVAVLERAGGRVDLVIADMRLPGASAREVVARLAAVCPGLAVLYVSGYPTDVPRGAGAGEPHAFLQKPFTVDALAGTVRRLLDGRASRRG